MKHLNFILDFLLEKINNTPSLVLLISAILFVIFFFNKFGGGSK